MESEACQISPRTLVEPRLVSNILHGRIDLLLSNIKLQLHFSCCFKGNSCRSFAFLFQVANLRRHFLELLIDNPCCGRTNQQEETGNHVLKRSIESVFFARYMLAVLRLNRLRQFVF